MKFPKTIERDTKGRDAAMINGIFKRHLLLPTEISQEKFDNAEKWFVQKHGCKWQDCLKDSDLKEEGHGL